MRDGHPHIGRSRDAGFFPVTILYRDLCRTPLRETLGKRKPVMIKCTVLMQIAFCRGLISEKEAVGEPVRKNLPDSNRLSVKAGGRHRPLMRRT
ncbi:hypothetical protein HMPREF9141_1973 [Prevotella multiformis DSM 16608]|uniref:Uncharacterized protein n=1 Tax=Prevotella multiformis DSM 16608 TaxID=888743 RepID=F0F8Q6_9BACT|nr:hypothetical protein HMPREF9141_1973 [Prevotella multiformis DSM 16608]